MFQKYYTAVKFDVNIFWAKCLKLFKITKICLQLFVTEM